VFNGHKRKEKCIERENLSVLAKVTQVSDVAHGSLVRIGIKVFKYNSTTVIVKMKGKMRPLFCNIKAAY
jgi:hypothetical protein